MIHGILLDLEGVLHWDNRPLPGAREAILSLYAAGIPVRLITNTTRLSPRDIASKLAQMGLDIPSRDVFTPLLVAREYLRVHGLIPYLLVHPNLQAELIDLIAASPNAVLLGDAGPAFKYDTLNAAFQMLVEGAPLLAMGNSRCFHENQGFTLGAGPFIVALEYAANTKAIALGKPAPVFFLSAVKSLGMEPDQVAMVSDNATVDVRGAITAGLQGLLVRTGNYKPGDEETVQSQGARVFENIDEAVDYIL